MKTTKHIDRNSGLWDETNKYRLDLLNEYAEKLIDSKSIVRTRLLLSHFMIDLEEQNQLDKKMYSSEEVIDLCTEIIKYVIYKSFPLCSDKTKEHIFLKMVERKLK